MNYNQQTKFVVHKVQHIQSSTHAMHMKTIHNRVTNIPPQSHSISFQCIHPHQTFGNPWSNCVNVARSGTLVERRRFYLRGGLALDMSIVHVHLWCCINVQPRVEKHLLQLRFLFRLQAPRLRHSAFDP